MSREGRWNKNAGGTSNWLKGHWFHTGHELILVFWERKDLIPWLLKWYALWQWHTYKAWDKCKWKPPLFPLQAVTFSQVLSAPGQHLAWLSSTAPSPLSCQCRSNRSAYSGGLPDWKRHDHFKREHGICKGKRKLRALCIDHYHQISKEQACLIYR